MDLEDSLHLRETEVVMKMTKVNLTGREGESKETLHNMTQSPGKLERKGKATATSVKKMVKVMDSAHRKGICQTVLGSW